MTKSPYLAIYYPKEMPSVRISGALTTEAALAELGLRLAQRRIQLGQTQDELATEAGVSKRTVERLEAGESTQLSSWLRVVRALNLMSRIDSLVPEPSSSPIEKLAAQSKVRRRVSRTKATAGKPWKWGDTAPPGSPSGRSKPTR